MPQGTSLRTFDCKLLQYWSNMCVMTLPRTLLPRSSTDSSRSDFVRPCNALPCQSYTVCLQSYDYRLGAARLVPGWVDAVMTLRGDFHSLRRLGIQVLLSDTESVAKCMRCQKRACLAVLKCNSSRPCCSLLCIQETSAFASSEHQGPA